MGLFLKKRVEMPDNMILGNTEFVFDRKLGFHVGEWTVWDRKTKILLEFQSTEGNIGDIVLEKVNWVNDHKDTIIRSHGDRSCPLLQSPVNEDLFTIRILNEHRRNWS